MARAPRVSMRAPHEGHHDSDSEYVESNAMEMSNGTVVNSTLSAVPEDGHHHHKGTHLRSAMFFTDIWAAIALLIIFSWVLRAWLPRSPSRPSRRNAGHYEHPDEDERVMKASLPRPQPRLHPTDMAPGLSARIRRWVTARASVARTAFAFTGVATPRSNLSAGQVFILSSFFALLVICVLSDGTNANRPAFLALAQLPLLLLLATKASPVHLARAFFPGLPADSAALTYAPLNYLHRWVGRALFACGSVHGALWITDHLRRGVPVFGAMETTGAIAWTTLLTLTLSSLPWVREAMYEVFLYVHILGFLTFVVVLRMHTHHATPWLAAALGLYILDVLVRATMAIQMLKRTRWRGCDAALQAVGEELTLITVPEPEIRWIAGQHVRLRVVFLGDVTPHTTLHTPESHPFTICAAPWPYSNIIRAGNGGDEGMGNGDHLVLGARVSGDWTRALNTFARSRGVVDGAGDEGDSAGQFVIGKEDGAESGDESDSEAAGLTNAPSPSPNSRTTRLSTYNPVQARVLLDGPYGGCTLDLPAYSRVLLVAGGSGATFALAMLDDLVGRCLRCGIRGLGDERPRTRRVDFVWVVRTFDSVNWFASHLRDIVRAASQDAVDLDVRISIFATRGLPTSTSTSTSTAALSRTEALLGLRAPYLTLNNERPDISALLHDLLLAPSEASWDTTSTDESDSIPLEDVEKGSVELERENKGQRDYPNTRTSIDDADLDDPSSALPLLHRDDSPRRIDEPTSTSDSSTRLRARTGGATRTGGGGGVGVCASGPAGLMRAVSDAVACVALKRGAALGGIGLHTEAFAL